MTLIDWGKGKKSSKTAESAESAESCERKGELHVAPAILGHVEPTPPSASTDLGLDMQASASLAAATMWHPNTRSASGGAVETSFISKGVTRNASSTLAHTFARPAQWGGGGRGVTAAGGGEDVAGPVSSLSAQVEALQKGMLQLEGRMERGQREQLDLLHRLLAGNYHQHQLRDRNQGVLDPGNAMSC